VGAPCKPLGQALPSITLHFAVTHRRPDVNALLPFHAHPLWSPQNARPWDVHCPNICQSSRQMHVIREEFYAFLGISFFLDALIMGKMLPPSGNVLNKRCLGPPASASCLLHACAEMRWFKAFQAGPCSNTCSTCKVWLPCHICMCVCATAVCVLRRSVPTSSPLA